MDITIYVIIAAIFAALGFNAGRNYKNLDE